MGFLETCRYVLETAAHPWTWYRDIGKVAWALTGLLFLLPGAVCAAEVLPELWGSDPAAALPAALLIPGAFLPHTVLCAAGGLPMPFRLSGYAAYFLAQAWCCVRIRNRKFPLLKDFGQALLADAAGCLLFPFAASAAVPGGAAYIAVSGALIRAGIVLLLVWAGRCFSRGHFQLFCATVLWLAEKNGIGTDEEWDRFAENTENFRRFMEEYEAMETGKRNQTAGGKT